MTTISIIGAGNMAAAIGIRAAKHGHAVEIMSRDTAKAQALADTIGTGSTVGTYGSRPAGDIVVVAILFANSVDVVTHFGEALAGKVLVDISNPFNADASGLVTTEGASIAQQIAAVAPESAQVIKGFNMLFRGVIAADKPVDVFFAGGNSEARERFAALVTSLGMRPRDAGGLEMTWAIEWASIALMGLARNGAGFDTALAAETL